MDIRLIGLDLDGTVFDSQKRISPRTRSAIAAACARGVAVLPATGRPRAGLPDAFVQIPGVRYAITSNGGAVYDLAPRIRRKRCRHSWRSAPRVPSRASRKRGSSAKGGKAATTCPPRRSPALREHDFEQLRA